MSGKSEEGRSVWLLALGALVGLVLAAGSLLNDGEASADLGDTAVARVNDTAIRRADFERLVAGLESDTREIADEKVRRRVLDRMIDEELLVQRGVDLGLIRVDRKVRADLVSAMIASVASEAEDRQPEQGELRTFYDENRDFFTRPGRLRVRQVFLRVAEPDQQDAVAAQGLEAAAKLRAGEDFDRVRQEFGAGEVSILPDVMLPATKLREYVGPTALRTVMRLPDGAVSDPVRSGMGYHVLWRVGSEPDQVPGFDEIRAQVESEWRRRTGDRALRDYLDDLRASADVTVLETLK